jgi:uncharacterized protein (TIGR02118 family)
MHKVVVLYNQPANADNFRAYYEGHHLPLAARLPGLLASRHSFDIGAAGPGPAPFFAIWEGDFADASAAGAAMQSDIGQAVAADVSNYADGGFTIFQFTFEND